MNELLAMFKKNIGRLDDGTELDDYYKEQLNAALAILENEDISASVLSSSLGQYTTVLIATKLMNNEDIANNSTIYLLRNKLSAATKGERYDNRQ